MGRLKTLPYIKTGWWLTSSHPIIFKMTYLLLKWSSNIDNIKVIAMNKSIVKMRLIQNHWKSRHSYLGIRLVIVKSMEKI